MKPMSAMGWAMRTAAAAALAFPPPAFAGQAVSVRVEAESASAFAGRRFDGSSPKPTAPGEPVDGSARITDERMAQAVSLTVSKPVPRDVGGSDFDVPEPQGTKPGKQENRKKGDSAGTIALKGLSWLLFPVILPLMLLGILGMFLMGRK